MVEHYLVIVESPTKCKLIAKYLQNTVDASASIIVKASLGHIKDLPEGSLGIERDVGNGRVSFSTEYAFIKGRKKLVDELGRLLKKNKNSELVLATDDDYEGESIAWHLQQTIGNNMKVSRMRFNEITERAICDGFEKRSPELNAGLVEAQKARRCIDRLVGYKLTPKLKHPIGRVQMGAMRILLKEEEGRKECIKKVEGRFLINDGNVLTLTLRSNDDIDGQKLLGQKGQVNIKRTESTVKGPPPYCTATALRDGIRLLGKGSLDVMEHLQSLYESGYITYHRTTSTRLKDGYLGFTNVMIEGAHEAIRPCCQCAEDFQDVEEDVKVRLGIACAKLYNMICKRVCAAVQPVQTRVEYVASIELDGLAEPFTGHVTVPVGLEGECIGIVVTETAPHPLPHLDEAGLIKEMERFSIGRPSTYASTISKLVAHKYVVFENVPGLEYAITRTEYSGENKTVVEMKGLTRPVNRAIILTDLGKVVAREMMARWPELADLEFSRCLEGAMDLIAANNGQKKSDDVIEQVWRLVVPLEGGDGGQYNPGGVCHKPPYRKPQRRSADR